MNITDFNVTDTVTIGNYELHPRDGVISNATLQVMMKAAYSGLIPVMAMVGLVCNIFSFVLLCPIKKRSATNLYLISLTVCDVCILLCALIVCTVTVLDIYGYSLFERIRILMIPVFLSYINPLPGSISNYLITLIAVDRFFAVVFPLKVRLFCGRRFAITAIVAAYVIPAIVSLPLALLYENNEINDTKTGKIVDIVSLTAFGRDKQVTSIIYVTTEITLRFTPVGLVVAASSGTIISLIYQSRKSRLRTHSMPTGPRDMRVTKTLLILTTAFLLTNLPGTITRCVLFLQSNVHRARREDNLHWMLTVTWYIFFVANSSINFPIYLITCREYRQQFQKIICKNHPNKSDKYVCKRQRESISHISQ
ncbi:probable G-protein coupled receptor B0563.6 [Ylistrum balloti]|uniref:probable G-protein coupled receptor B0563.6 n=1 Tax=Ylistrum balloti TaxID=509963 RepID=UPI002905E48B|nr:probable G-protein coupled receptor B0563.6 [Ylistrum balloti]